MGTSRTVTALFTDIVGSTEQMSRMGAVEAEARRARHFAGIRGALAVHKGNEVKTLGDGFMAAFDSAADAVGCAVTMQRAVARDNELSEHAIGLRVGLCAGEVTVEEGDYFGMPVVTASRLCAAADGGQILAAEVIRMLVGDRGIHRLEPLAPLELKGVPEPVAVCRVDWDAEESFALRVALAEDNALLREGIASMLSAEGMDVVLQAGDAEELMAGLEGARPHVVICDVRMPPTHTTEGIDAAQRIRTEHPETGVLVLSAQVDPGAARRLLASGTDGIGYLLKDKVGDAAELTTAIRTLASGGSTIDPNVVSILAEASG
jgi:class 3 adenylate cyclase